MEGFLRTLTARETHGRRHTLINILYETLVHFPKITLHYRLLRKELRLHFEWGQWQPDVYHTGQDIMLQQCKISSQTEPLLLRVRGQRPNWDILVLTSVHFCHSGGVTVWLKPKTSCSWNQSLLFCQYAD